MIIDSHSHAWPRWPYQPPVPDGDSRGRIEQLLHEMDRHGVDQAVLVVPESITTQITTTISSSVPNSIQTVSSNSLTLIVRGRILITPPVPLIGSRRRRINTR